MINGKSLFLDIGTDSIKAVEIAKTTDKMMLTNATIISDARRYLSEYGVENMSGLVNCIRDELENSGFTAKRVYIASSSLRIESLLEITDDSGKAQPSKADEASNTSIVSKQVYGSIVCITIALASMRRMRTAVLQLRWSMLRQCWRPAALPYARLTSM